MHFVRKWWQMYESDVKSYHLVDMNTFILLAESQVILNRITDFKSNPQVRIQGKNAQGTVRMMRLVRLCIKGAPSNGLYVPILPVWLRSHRNINLNILFGCKFVIEKLSIHLWTK